MGLFKKKSPGQKALVAAVKQRLQNAHSGKGSWGPVHQELRDAVIGFELGQVSVSWEHDTMPDMARQYADLWLAAGPNPTGAEVDHLWDNALKSFWHHRMWPDDFADESLALGNSIAHAVMNEVLTQTGMTRS